CHEAVEGNTRDQVVTADPLYDVLTDIGDGTEQGDDHLGTPIGHLAPGQYIAHEGLGHQHQINGHAENPHQFAGRLVGAIDQAAEHVQIDHEEKRGGTGGVDVAYDPAVLHIAHDVFDGGKGTLGTT